MPSCAAIPWRKLVALVLAVGGGLLSCGRTAAEAPPRSQGGPSSDEAGPLRVATTTLRPFTIERRYRTSGTMEAIREATIVAKEPGILRSIAVYEGEPVKSSQVLARLDGRELALQAASARLQAQNLEHELARLESAQGGVISREEIDKQRYAVEEARVLARLSGVVARQTVVRAPFAGTIVERLVDEGNLATTTTPLFRLADLSVLRLEIHLPERDAASVDLSAPVELELVDGTKFSATILRKAPIVDAMTGTVKFTLEAQTFPPAAMPGAFVRADLPIARRAEAPSLPRSAVFEVEGDPQVFVLREGRARRVPVKVGIEGSDRVEILGGLDSEDAVVVEGNAGITEGMPLQGQPAVDEAP